MKQSIFCKRFFLVIAVFLACASVFCQEENDKKSIFVEYGKQYIGRPYKRGGIGPTAFDCSGLVYTVAREALGLQLPRTSLAIYKFSTIIEDTDRQVGDIVFFKTTSSGSISHCGIYVGDNSFLHAASDGPHTGVVISSLDEKYWKKHYVATGRIM